MYKPINNINICCFYTNLLPIETQAVTKGLKTRVFNTF